MAPVGSFDLVIMMILEIINGIVQVVRAIRSVPPIPVGGPPPHVNPLPTVPANISLMYSTQVYSTQQVQAQGFVVVPQSASDSEDFKDEKHERIVKLPNRRS